jgi:acetyltransferase-like isoleucine patch superfamily enzyme
MTKPIIIFGTGDLAQVAHFYLTHDSDYTVEAFTVDRDYLSVSTFCDLPVVPFEELENLYPPQDFEIFIAVSYAKVNVVRASKYESANTIQPFVKIGNNVTLWSGNHIGHHSTIGDNCFITSHVVVSGGVNIGKNCFIGVNATLRDHINIADKCVIGAGVLLLADVDTEGVYMGTATERSKVPSRRLKI